MHMSMDRGREALSQNKILGESFVFILRTIMKHTRGLGWLQTLREGMQVFREEIPRSWDQKQGKRSHLRYFGLEVEDSYGSGWLTSLSHLQQIVLPHSAPTVAPLGRKESPARAQRRHGALSRAPGRWQHVETYASHTWVPARLPQEASRTLGGSFLHIPQSRKPTLSLGFVSWVSGGHVSLGPRHEPTHRFLSLG